LPEKKLFNHRAKKNCLTAIGFYYRRYKEHRVKKEPKRKSRIA
jgi:hypothetical protein